MKDLRHLPDRERTGASRVLALGQWEDPAASPGLQEIDWPLHCEELRMHIIVETFRNPGEPSSARIRVRPVEGQGYPMSMRVECSRAMRESAPVGSRFRVFATLKQGDSHGGHCLYVNKADDWEQVK